MSNSTAFRILEKYSDLFLALAVVLIISVLVVRIPPEMMDVLIAINIGAAVTVLLVALYVSEAIRLPSFPTILLLTTLFRLALNVSTTRLILLDANAGEIINAFGNFVVGGNYVVGGVVFLVLVLIQFIVIAKGSERVAEVSARFTLDAMPGKQMSIDADVRSGMISQEEARARRQDLERESKLYGAMDGAMKFVKGDAIAGIVISVVNIVGGLIIGVMQQGMPAAEAAQVYSLLTIGDGLVSQIPALLISVSAGLVVTRVAASMEPKAGNLGRDLLNQMLGNPKAVGIVAFILLVLGASSETTGFPRLPFLALGGLAAVVAFVRYRSPVVEEERAERAEGGPGGEEEALPSPAHAMLGPVPLVLEIHESLVPLFLERTPIDGSESYASSDATIERLKRLRDSVSQEMGVEFPPINLRIGSSLPEEDGYVIQAFDAPLARGTFPPEKSLVLDVAENVRALGLDAEPCRLPGTRAEFCRVERTELEGAKTKLRPKSPEDLILNHLKIAMKQNAAEFLGIQEVHNLLEALKERASELVKALLQTELTLQQVTEVLKLLLRQRVPIRNFRAIIESLAKWGAVEKNPQVLVECVRQDLRRVLSSYYAVNQRTLRFYDVGPDIVSLLLEYDRPSLTQLEQRRQLIPTIERAVDPRRHLGSDPVLLVNADVRWLLWSIVCTDLPEVVVLSHQELTPEIQIEPIGVITLDTPELSGVEE